MVKQRFCPSLEHQDFFIALARLLAGRPRYAFTSTHEKAMANLRRILEGARPA